MAADKMELEKILRDEEERSYHRRIEGADPRRPRGALDVALIGTSAWRVIRDPNPGEVFVQAERFYVGRVLDLSLRLTTLCGWEPFLLSSLHGAVAPAERIPATEIMFASMYSSEHDRWGEKVVDDLLSLYVLTHVRVIFLAGDHFVRAILPWLRKHVGYWSYKAPLAGLSTRERIGWLKAHVEG